MYTFDDTPKQNKNDNAFEKRFSQNEKSKKKNLTIKVTMVGDAAVGKTSFMARFVDGTFAEDYVETLGVNYMNKTIKFRTSRSVRSFIIQKLCGRKKTYR